MSHYLDKPVRTIKQVWTERVDIGLKRTRLLLKATKHNNNRKQDQNFAEIDKILEDLVKTHYTGELSD